MSNVSVDLALQAFPIAAYPGDPDIDFSPDYMRWLLYTLFRGSPGVAGAGDFALSQHGTGNWSFDVAAGSAIVTGSGNQRYHLHNDSPINVDVSTLNTAPVAMRTHKVYLAVYDKNYAGSSYTPTIFVGEDTGSGAPTPTGSPVGSLQIGQFTISPSQTSLLTSHITNNPAYADRAGAWTNVTLNGGYVDNTSGTLPMQYRRTGNRVELRGRVARTGGAQFAAFSAPSTGLYQVCILPTFLRPLAGRIHYFPVATNLPNGGDTPVGRIYVHNDGSVFFQCGNYLGADQPDTISFDGVYWDLI